MRILYVTAHYPPDFVSGATLQVRRIAERVAAMGHDVAVLSGHIRPGLADGEHRSERLGGVEVHWIGTAGRIEQDVDENWRNAAATSLVRSLIATFRPAVIHAHALQTLGGDFLTVAKDHHVATVVTMHDFWWWCSRLFLVDRSMQPCPLLASTSDCACARTSAWRQARIRDLQSVLAGVDQVLVPSKAMRDLVVANGIPPQRVDVDENDVDRSALSPNAVVPSVSGDVRFLYVGGDSVLKGRDVILSAAERLRRLRGWSLTLYGVTRRPRRRLRRADRRITFHDAYAPEDTGTILANADVLVIPSIARESFSIAAREALGSGVAVISSDCLGPTEVVRDGFNGRIVPTADVAALAAAMRSMVLDRQTMLGMRRAASRSRLVLRDPDEHAAALVATYARLVVPPRRVSDPNGPGSP